MLWTDEPISSAAQDTLGRAPFAGYLADLVERSHDPDSSIVIGITGPWGSGKTSAFAMARRHLDPELWSVVELNPWVAADDDSMLAEFFAALSRALPPKRGDVLKKHLATCASVVGPGLSAIPLAGGAVSKYAEKLEKYLNARKPWPAVFGSASAEFRALGRRIVVFIDDCDRLDPAELRTLLKVVRLIGRFPGITYVLAYDEETLSRTLSAAGVGDNTVLGAQRYLEKIVQFIAPVPSLTASEVLTRLLASIDPAMRTHGWDPEVLGEYRLTQAFEDVMLRRLATPRSVDRFAAQAATLLAHLEPSEFDPIDLLLLLFARLQFPEAYAQLPHWSSQLLGSGRVGTDPWKPGSGTSVDWEPLLRYAGDRPEDRRDFELALRAVFPALDQHTSAEDGAIRASSPLYFERHVYFAVPRAETREKDVTEALEAARQDPPDYSGLDQLLSPTTTNYAVALQKMRRRTETWEKGDVSVEFVLHVADLHVGLDDRLGTAHFGSALLFWAGSLLPLMDRETDPADLVTALRTHLGDELTAVVAKRMLGSAREDTWSQSIVKRVSEMCISSAMSQLHEGDNAPVSSHIHSYVAFLRSIGLFDQLTAPISRALANGELAIDDIAARCVSVLTPYSDGSTFLDTVDDRLLASLAGSVELPSPTTTTWPDRLDLTWANRREWARWALGPGRTTGLPER